MCRDDVLTLLRKTFPYHDFEPDPRAADEVVFGEKFPCGEDEDLADTVREGLRMAYEEIHRALTAVPGWDVKETGNDTDSCWVVVGKVPAEGWDG